MLMALMQGLLAEDEETFRPVVLELCLSLYKREKADASMMGYLCRYYNGSTSQMLSVLEKTCSLCGNVKDMPERLLAQMLFAEQTEKLDFVFSVYSAQEQLYHILVQAYFVWKSYRGFAVGEAMPDYFFGFLERYYKQSAFQQEGKVLAGAWLLEHLTKQEEPDLELVQQITDFLCEEHRCFAFYQALPEGVRLPESLNGCMILEYRSDQPGEYYVQYDRYPGGVNSGLLKMHAMCQGVYAEPVMIFPGETLTVTYLRRYQGEEELLVCGQQLPYHKVFSIPGSLYDSLNQICTLLEKKTQASDQAAEEALTQMRIREKMLTCLMHEGQKGENET